MKRLLLLLLQIYLRIAIILANSSHSCFLRVCKVIAEIFQLPVTNSLNDSTSTDSEETITHDAGSKISISTQTQENINQSENTANKSGTDVIIYNLNSTQRLVISQDTFRKRKCKNCKSVTQISLEETEDETGQTELETLQTSCMSIENDVIDSNIENGYVILESTRDEINCLQVETNSKNKNSNADSTKEKECVNSDTFDILNSNTKNDRYLNNVITYLNSKITSSPKETLQSNQGLFRNLSMPNAPNESQTKRIKDTEKSIYSDHWKRDALASNFKRRLSLPVKLNTTNSATSFKLAQQKLIEETLKSTPRHEKSVKQIKYPFSSDISLDNSKPNDGMEDKEVFSCSSYESLPVSDHLRNAFENNTLLKACNESLYSEDIPDLFCVDNLVEGFNDDPSFLSVENISQRTLIPPTLLKTENNDSYEDQHSSLQSMSSNGNMSKDNPKPTNNFKKRMISNFTSESNSSINDMVDELDKFVDNEIYVVSNVCVCCNKELNNNSVESEVNSQNKESDMNENESGHSPSKNKFVEHLNLKQEIEEALGRYALDSDVSEDFENNISSVIGSAETKPSDYHKYFYQIVHRTESDILIDDIPLNDTNQAIQSISETSCQNLNLSNKSRTSENPNESLLSDQFQWSGESENSVLIEKDEEINDSYMLEQTLQQFQNEFNEDLLHETRSTNQCLSGENCQNTLENEKKRRKKSKRSRNSKNKAKNSDLKTPSPVQQQSSHAVLLSNKKSTLDKSEVCQNILEASNEESQILSEDPEKPLEKITSSGDSASDNSVVTVKDLSIEGKIEENLPSENDS